MTHPYYYTHYEYRFDRSNQRKRKRRNKQYYHIISLIRLLTLQNGGFLVLLCLCTTKSHLDLDEHNNNGDNYGFKTAIPSLLYSSAFTIPARSSRVVYLRNKSYELDRTKTKGRNHARICTRSTLSDENKIETLHHVDIDEEIKSNASLCLDRDHTQQGLISHAPESFYLLNRSIQRLNGAFVKMKRGIDTFEGIAQYDNKTRDLCHDIHTLGQCLLKPEYSIHLNITTSTSTSTSCQKTFQIDNWFVYKDLEIEKGLRINYKNNTKRYFWNDAMSTTQLYHNMTCLQLSHEVLKTSVESSIQEQTIINKDHSRWIVSQIERRLSVTMGSDLRGRKSADAAFNLALAGVQNSNHIFDSLVSIAIHELKRVGQRSSFKPKYVLQMIEKFAISGASSSTLLPLYQIAAKNLELKKHTDIELIHNLSNGEFGLHSDRPLLWLWRFSTRQRKINPKEISPLNASKRIAWDDIFDEPNNNLVIDIGCGMGVSLLNSAIRSRTKEYEINDETREVQWSSCNYVGTDLNQMMTRYANGVVSRLDDSNIEKCIHFFNLPAEDFLNNILMTYKGRVSLVMIQFPSPYRLIDSNKAAGNSQLPASTTEGFMVNESLLCIIADILKMNGGCGKLLFQTKCEDVAIFMKNVALNTGHFECVPCSHPVLNIDEDVYFKSQTGKRPVRVEQWLSSYNEQERAEGSSWSASSLVPSFSRSETEVACDDNGTFIHQCILKRV